MKLSGLFITEGECVRRLNLIALTCLIITLAISGYSVKAVADLRDFSAGHTLAEASMVVDARMYDLHLPALSVAEALTLLSEQTDLLVLFPYEIAASRTANAVIGRYRLQYALNLMLQGSGLSGGLTQDDVITISLRPNERAGDSMNSKKQMFAALTAMLMGSGSSVSALGQEVAAAGGHRGLDEIIVTATKRESNLNETASSIAAISGEDISSKGLSDMDDYLRITPGVSFIDRGTGQNAIIVRGIQSDPQLGQRMSGPTVGVYFGEAPISGLGIQGASTDIKLVDMERVEILRGPQGTLFGSGALSGAVRNIPNAPNLSEVEGSLKTEFSSTSKFGGENSKFEGVLNIPLIEEVLALRVVAYRHDDSGYIKNVAGSDPDFSQKFVGLLEPGQVLSIDEDEVGTTITEGGRLTALWKPTEDLDITFQYIHQEVEQDGTPYIHLETGTYTQAVNQVGDAFSNGDDLIDSSGSVLSGNRGDGLTDDLDTYNLVVEYDLGWASLLSSTFYVEEDSLSLYDVHFDLANVPTSLLQPETSEAFMQEVRLASQNIDRWQYLIGAYYENIAHDYKLPLRRTGDVSATVPSFLIPFGQGSNLVADYTVEGDMTQKAVFGEISYEIIDNLTATVGARWFEYKRAEDTTSLGLFGDFVDNDKERNEDGTNFKASISFTPNDDALVYAQWAEGFRLGNVQLPIPLSLCDVEDVNGDGNPDQDGVLDGTNAAFTDSFSSDSVSSFELGGKFTLLENRMQFNTAVFRTIWKDIPISSRSPTCFFSLVVNAGEAVSQGFEVELVYQATDSLVVNVGGSYSNTELSIDTPELDSVAGDRLPASPDYNISLGLQYDYLLAGHEAYLRSDYAYVGGFYNNFQQSGFQLGSYGQLNASAGVRFNNFTFSIFGKNLTNQDDLTWIGNFESNTPAYRLRPVTVGVNLGYRF